MKTTIEGKVALVTGSNRGIGRAIVDALIARGASKVYAAARNADALQPLVEAHGERVVPAALDVTQPDQVAAVAAQASDVQVLVNNAGFAAQTDIFADDINAARQEFEVNYWGVLNMLRAFVPLLENNGGAAVINVASVASLVNFPPLPTYSDSKAAVHSLTQGVRLTKGAAGIQVVGVYPGPVDTDMAADLEMEKASPQSVAETILNGVEAGKVDVFPDAMAEGFIPPYAAGAKVFEAQTAEMLAGGAE
ncbi:MAG: SDR family oxidoreductase [Opitutales bacterium]|nr:SDR family oxidoreductase [Opitutales bacterium]